MVKLIVLCISLAASAIGVAAGGPPPADSHAFSVAVLPRIGMFDPLFFRSAYSDGTRYIDGFYVRQESGWYPAREDDYASKLPAYLKNLFPPGWNWQLITTEGYSRPGEPMPAYSMRLFSVSLAPSLRGRAKNCQLIVEGEAENDPGHLNDATCAYSGYLLRLRSNREAAVVLKYDLDSQRGLVSRIVVPEDFLIVVLGDSYAAGEGNPDIESWRALQPGAKHIGSTRPVWSDVRCHRSSWAGGMQAGLRLLKGNQSRTPGIPQNGAFTIINLACSGAQLEWGVLSDYEGAITREEYSDALPTGVERPRGFLMDAVPPQLSVLRKVLEGQRSPNRKTSVDALIVSGSGNDVRFGPLIESFVTETVTAEDRDHFKERVDARFKDLREKTFPEFKAALERLQKADADLGRTAYRIEHLLVAEYPDPTRLVENASSVSDFCDSHVFLNLGDSVLTITSANSKWAYENIVVPLNDHVKQNASANNALYLGGIAREFVGRGLCAKSGSGPYDEADRYFRSALDSLKYQGDKLGTFHPTWQGHVVYAKHMEEAIRTGLSKSLNIELSDATKAGIFENWIGPALDVVITRSGSASTGMDKWCLESEISGYCEPTRDWRLPTLADGASIELKVRAVHSETGRLWRRDFGRFRIDALPPKLSSCVIASAGKGETDCALQRWIAGDAVLKIRAVDNAGGSGVGKMNLKLASALREKDEKPVTIAIPSTGEAPGELVVSKEIPDGVWLASGEVIDKVRNATPLFNPTQIIRVDRTPPVLSAATIYGVDVGRIGAWRQVPVMTGDWLDLIVSATDATPGSGVGRAFATFARAGGEIPSQYFGAELGCGEGDVPKSKITTQVQPTLFAVRDAYKGGVLRFGVMDCAGNESGPVSAISVARVNPASSPSASVRYWVELLKKNPSAMDNARLYSLAFADELPGDGDPRWNVLAAWLNLINGRALPSAPILGTLDEGCSVSAVSTTLYAFLLDSERCLARNPLGEGDVEKIAKVLEDGQFVGKD